MLKIINNRHGTSLIEILTALAVLVIGILSVSRMFSGGFVVLKRSENFTIASRFAEREMERLRGRTDGMPLGIVAVEDPADPDSISPHPGPPLTDYNRNSFRRIIGEPVKIPGPSLDQGTSGALIGSVYRLAFAPVATLDRIYSARMERRVVDSGNNDSDPWEWLSLTSYAIDYDAGKVAFRGVSYPRDFSLAFSYWTSDDNGRQLHNVSVTITVPPHAGWLDIPGINRSNVTDEDDFTEIDEWSDRVAREFELIPDGQPWAVANPYQYKVSNLLTGRIVFNPNGYSYKEPTPLGTQDLTAYIDYTIADWGIISESLQVPSSGPLRVRTTLRNIKQNGVTVEDDGMVYAGIAPMSAPLGTNDVIIVDEATGEIIPAGPAGASGVVVVDYQNGALDFPATVLGTGGTIDMAGKMVRVYYRAESDWQVQVQKAFENYDREYNVGIDYREFRIRPGSNTELLVSRADCAKTFSVDYTAEDANGNTFKVVGEVVRATDGTPVRHGPDDCAVLTLRNTIHEDYSVRVRGLSVKVRVLWSEGSKLDIRSARIVPKFQYYDLDSNMTRGTSAL